MNLKELLTEQEKIKENIEWLKHELKDAEETAQDFGEALKIEQEKLLKLQQLADIIRNQKEY